MSQIDEIIKNKYLESIEENYNIKLNSIHNIYQKCINDFVKNMFSMMVTLHFKSDFEVKFNEIKMRYKDEVEKLNKKYHLLKSIYADLSINESVDKSVDKSINESVDLSINEYVDKSINEYVDNSIDLSINECVDESIN